MEARERERKGKRGNERLKIRRHTLKLFTHTLQLINSTKK